MKNKSKKRPWLKPKIVILTADTITSGNVNDVRAGEFIAPFEGTFCPFTTQQCIEYSELEYIFNTGKNDTRAICYEDDLVNFNLIAFCS